MSTVQLLLALVRQGVINMEECMTKEGYKRS